MKVRWSAGALADLRDITFYIDVRNAKAAQRVKQKIILALYQLRDFPQIGTAVHRADTRKLVVTGLPYILIYRVDGDSVKISSVIDARMDRAPDLL